MIRVVARKFEKLATQKKIATFAKIYIYQACGVFKNPQVFT
jgi:hypothetical protein